MEKSLVDMELSKLKIYGLLNNPMNMYYFLSEYIHMGRERERKRESNSEYFNRE